MRVLVVFAAFLAFANSQRLNKGNSAERNPRLFSLFNIVTFKNEPCQAASDTDIMGTCFTRQECQNNGGSANGNCASGFGVCCVFTLSTCGGTVRRNCTYIQNQGFPTGSNTLQTCTFTFARICDDLCSIRLDFDNLVLSGPTANTGTCANDRAVATSPTGASPPSNICGTLTGQHMYLDTGATGNAGSLAITTGTDTNTLRSYNVKVSYIECSNLSRPPAGCVQYFTGVSNSIQSYNFQGNQQLDDQNYALCIRQEEGFCSYQIASSMTAMPNPFLLRDNNAAINDQGGGNAVETGTCLTNYVSFPSTVSVTSDEICGEIFGATDGATVPSVVTAQRVTPFVIDYFSELSANIAATMVTTGFNLEYTQTPC